MSAELLLTRAQLREIDRIAIEEYGMPSSVLMENAGRGAAECVLELCGGARSLDRRASRANDPPREQAAVAVVCGPGNNGGDGGVLARHLANAGVHVEVFVTEPRDALRGDAALQRRIVELMHLPVHDVSSAEALADAESALTRVNVIVDALLGTGFHGAMRPKIARVIERLNRLRTERALRVVALDLPSGLDCDTGVAAEPTVIADITVAFAARKIGFDTPSARAVVGEVRVAPIGVPVAILERVRRENRG